MSSSRLILSPKPGFKCLHHGGSHWAMLRDVFAFSCAGFQAVFFAQKHPAGVIVSVSLNGLSPDASRGRRLCTCGAARSSRPGFVCVRVEANHSESSFSTRHDAAALKSSELSPKKDGCKSDSAGVQGPVPAPKTWCWEAQTASFQCPAYLHRDSTVTAMTGNEMQGIIFGAVQLSNRSSGGLGQIVSA